MNKFPIQNYMVSILTIYPACLSLDKCLKYLKYIGVWIGTKSITFCEVSYLYCHAYLGYNVIKCDHRKSIECNKQNDQFPGNVEIVQTG